MVDSESVAAVKFDVELGKDGIKKQVESAGLDIEKKIAKAFERAGSKSEKSVAVASGKIKAILQGTSKSAKGKAASIAHIFKKAGLDSSDAFKTAWTMVDRESAEVSKKVQSRFSKIGNNLKRAFSSTSVTKLGNTFDRTASKMHSTASKLGATLAAALSVGATIAFGKSCIELGSDLTEVQNVVDTVFPNMTAKVDDWSKKAAESVGLSETMAKKYTGTFGAMSKAFGFTESQAYSMSTALAGLAGDVASFYNITQDEAYTKLKSVFSGETETLKDLGIVMTQNALDAYAMANGYGKVTSAMSEQEKVELRLAFVTGQLSAAQGDFAKTSDQWANQVRILQLNFESLKATMGQGFINLFAPVLKVINTVIARLSVLAAKFKALTEFLTGKSSSSNESQINATAAGAADAEENLNAASGAADKLANATKKAAKASRSLMGFDKINKLNEKSGSDGSSKNSAAGGTPSVDASGLGDYEKEWNSKLSNMNKSAEDFAKKLKASLRPAQNALNRLYNQGFKKLSNFSCGTLKDFYKNFLKPLGSYVLGNGFPKLVDYTNKFLNDIKWNKLRKSLSDFYRVLYNIGKLGFTAIESFYKNVLLKLSKWALNKALPTLLDVFTDLSNRINWKTLNSAVSKFMKAVGNVAEGIGQGLINFVKGFYDATKKIAAATINALAKAFSAVATAISKFPQAGYDVIVGGIIGMAAAMKGFEKILAAVEAVKKFKTTISTVITLFGGNKIKLAIAAIGLLSGAIIALKGNNKISVKTEGIAELKQSLDEAKDSVNAVDRAIKDFKKNQSDINLEYDAIDDLAEKYYTLSQKTNKTAEEKRKLVQYSKQLVEQIPDLKGKIDTETGAYKGTYDQLKKTIKKTREYYLLQAAEKDLISVSKKLYTAKRNIAKVQDNLTSVTKKYNAAVKKKKAIDKDENGVLKMNAKEYDALCDTIEDYEAEIKSTKSSLEKYRGEYTKQSSTYDSISKDVSDLQAEYDSLSGSAKSAKNEIKGTNSELQNTPASKEISFKANTADVDTATSTATEGKSKEITFTGKKDDKYSQLLSDSEKPISKSVKLKLKNSVKKVMDGWQKDLNSHELYTVVKMKIDGKEQKVKLNFRNDATSSNYGYTWISKMATGGLYKNGKWNKITQYAGGGLPSQGQVFVAREKGPEMVGKIRNSTAVVNNTQIVASVASGVYKATAAAIQTIISKVRTPAIETKTFSAPPLAAVSGGNDNQYEGLKEMAKQAAQMSGNAGMTSEVIELLKQILDMLKKLDLDVYMDGEKVTKKIVSIINAHTRGNGGRCEII